MVRLQNYGLPQYKVIKRVANNNVYKKYYDKKVWCFYFRVYLKCKIEVNFKNLSNYIYTNNNGATNQLQYLVVVVTNEVLLIKVIV